MPGLRRCCRDLAADRNALARWQLSRELDLGDEQIKSPLRMGLDELELRERGREGLYVVAVLHFIESIVRRALFRGTTRLVAIAIERVRDFAGVGAGLNVDRQKA